MIQKLVQLKIKLNIADRLYPLTIQRSQEFYFREASKIIDKTIKNLEENYSVRDKQDVLAMCSLQYAAQLEKSNNQNHTNSPKSEDKIEELIDDLKKSYTIVIVTHSMAQAVRVSQKTGFFHLGKIIEVDSTEKIFKNPANKMTQDYITGRFG